MADAQGVSCEQCIAARETIHHLQQQLDESKQQLQQLNTCLTALADSHAQELEQARMDVEAEAAAAMLDAAAEAQQTQRLTQPQSQEAAVQVDIQQRASLSDAAVQTESAGQQDHQQEQTPGSGTAVLQRLQGCQPPLTAGDGPQPSQQLKDVQQDAPAPAAAVVAEVAAAPADRPCTPQPAAASSSADTAVNAVATISATAPVHGFVQQWQAAAGVGDAGDDDLCRVSSASDTPASASSRMHSSSDKQLCQLQLTAVAAANGGCSALDTCSNTAAADCLSTARPNSAGIGGVPELTESTSPVAAASYSKLLPPEGSNQWTCFLQQQQQKQNQNQDKQQWEHCNTPQQQQQPHSKLTEQQCHPVVQTQMQQQQQAPAQPDQVAQLSEWHIELLQQQAQLDLLRLRLSQHHQLARSSSTGPSQLQQQFLPTVPLLSRYGSLAKPDDAGAVAAATPMPPCSLAFGGADLHVVVAAGQTAQCSPAGPVAGSSPLTLQQRRMLRQHQASIAAGSRPLVPDHHQLPNVSAGEADVAGHKLFATVAAYTHRPAINSRHVQRYSQHAGDPFTGALSGTLPLGGSAMSGQPHSTIASRQGSACSGRRHTLIADVTLLQDAATDPSVTNNVRMRQSVEFCEGQQQAMKSNKHQHLHQELCSGNLALNVAGAATAAGDSMMSSSGGSGLAQLGQDVLGALSLSRIHMERSQMQEVRARQHVLMASHHEDQATALRSSRLLAGRADTLPAALATASALPVPASCFGTHLLDAALH